MATEITSEEQLAAWVKEQFQSANKFLAQEGILFSTVVTEESRYIAPHIAVWKIKDTKGTFYWVINGDLPADVALASNAPSAREAMRHFSLTWQMKADNILNTAGVSKEQTDFANLLIQKAEFIYQACEDKKLWQEEV